MRDTGDVRQRLLDAAIALLDAEGVDAVTIRAVARRAGVSHGAPRRYFPTRAQLLATLAQVGFTDLVWRLDALDSDGEPGGRLLEAASAYVEFARERPSLFELMARHDLLQASGIGLSQTSLAALARWHDLVRAARPDATRHDTLAVFAAVHGVAALHSRQALELLETTPAQLLELVLEDRPITPCPPSADRSPSVTQSPEQPSP